MSPAGVLSQKGVGRLLCHCMVIDEREVVACIRKGARTVDEVGACCEAGTGCGSCRGGIEVLLREEAERRAKGGAPDELLAQLGLFGGAGSDSSQR